ncbi:hypothetical protein FKM82_016967 [Ascaphus truei]
MGNRPPYALADRTDSISFILQRWSGMGEALSAVAQAGVTPLCSYLASRALGYSAEVKASHEKIHLGCILGYGRRLIQDPFTDFRKTLEQELFLD